MFGLNAGWRSAGPSTPAHHFQLRPFSHGWDQTKAATATVAYAFRDTLDWVGTTLLLPFYAHPHLELVVVMLIVPFVCVSLVP